MKIKNHPTGKWRVGFAPGPVAALVAAWCAWPPASTVAQTNSTLSRSPLEPVVVTDKFRSYHDVLSESDLVGPANQPEWTARRAFAETDVYVIPPGEIEFNQFYVLSHPREGKPESLFESEFGLPWRTQFDVELNYQVKNGKFQYDSTMLELPHALADWGKLPLNPALNVGWRFRDVESDAYLLGLLLADQFGERCHSSDSRMTRQWSRPFSSSA